jgi:shikimate kinase
MTNVILTGFMGTGKSTVGRRLASELGLKFLDIDEVIEKEEGLAVAEIFDKYGEHHFRSLESDVIRKLTSGGFGAGYVVSTGGGAAVNDANRIALKGWGVLVCLKASVDEVLKRVGKKNDRPLLASADRREAIERLMKERVAAYGDCDLTVVTDFKEIHEVVGIIKKFLLEKK